MPFDKKQFSDLIKRVLSHDDLYSEPALNLLLGTAAQESGFGTYLRQIGGGALGVFQIEKPTFKWLRDCYKVSFPHISNYEFESLEWDLKQSIIFCRLRYLVIPEALPGADDVEGLAKYWKKYYNTRLGAGKISEFIYNYKKYLE